MFFGKNTPIDIKQNIVTIAEVKINDSFKKYLELPIMVGRARTKSFPNLVGRTWNKIFN